MMDRYAEVVEVVETDPYYFFSLNAGDAHTELLLRLQYLVAKGTP